MNKQLTKNENILVTKAYLDGKSISEAQLLVPDKINLVKIKYDNF